MLQAHAPTVTGWFHLVSLNSQLPCPTNRNPLTSLCLMQQTSSNCRFELTSSSWTTDLIHTSLFSTTFVALGWEAILGLENDPYLRNMGTVGCVHYARLLCVSDSSWQLSGRFTWICAKEHWVIPEHASARRIQRWAAFGIFWKQKDVVVQWIENPKTKQRTTLKLKTPPAPRESAGTDGSFLGGSVFVRGGRRPTRPRLLAQNRLCPSFEETDSNTIALLSLTGVSCPPEQKWTSNVAIARLRFWTKPWICDCGLMSHLLWITHDGLVCFVTCFLRPEFEASSAKFRCLWRSNRLPSSPK